MRGIAGIIKCQQGRRKRKGTAAHVGVRLEIIWRGVGKDVVLRLVWLQLLRDLSVRLLLFRKLVEEELGNFRSAVDLELVTTASGLGKFVLQWEREWMGKWMREWMRELVRCTGVFIADGRYV